MRLRHRRGHRQKSGHGHREVDVLVVGGGQAGLAAGYHLRPAGFEPHTEFVILDAPLPGGSWQHLWDSLHLFSPAECSSLPA